MIDTKKTIYSRYKKIDAHVNSRVCGGCTYLSKTGLERLEGKEDTDSHPLPRSYLKLALMCKEKLVFSNGISLSILTMFEARPHA